MNHRHKNLAMRATSRIFGPWMYAMTYDEFHRHIGKAGLTLKAFAELVRMNRISLSNLSKKGEVPSHLAIIAALLGEMVDKGIDYNEVLSRIEVAPKKPRGTGKNGRFGGARQEDLFVRVDPNTPT